MSQTMTAVFLAGQDCARAATSYFPSFSDRERKVNENSASSAQATEVENAIAPAQVSAVNSRMGHLGEGGPLQGRSGHCAARKRSRQGTTGTPPCSGRAARRV